jgi:hypothetical protein
MDLFLLSTPLLVARKPKRLQNTQEKQNSENEQRFVE